MKFGILGAGNIGQTLKVMLGRVEGVSKASLADNAVPSDVTVDAATGENLSDFVAEHDAIVKALPFYLNQAIARACAEVRRSLCCTGRGRGRTGPYPVRGQAMRTDSGRPSSSMRLSAWTPTLTSVARRRSVRECSPSPITRL